MSQFFQQNYLSIDFVLMIPSHAEQKTSQATTGWGGVSSRAVDGDVDNQNWNNAGCSGTNQNPSW